MAATAAGTKEGVAAAATAATEEGTTEGGASVVAAAVGAVEEKTTVVAINCALYLLQQLGGIQLPPCKLCCTLVVHKHPPQLIGTMGHQPQLLVPPHGPHHCCTG